MVTSKYPPKKKSSATKGGSKTSGTCKDCGKPKAKCNC